MKYVYGIVPSRQVAEAPLALRGLHGQPLQIVACNGISAVVSEAVPYDYAGLPKQQLVKVLAQHQQATEQIMQHTTTLLPVKFGTMLPAMDVEKLLAQAKYDLEQALVHMDEQVELELLVIWEPQRIFAKLAEHPQIAALRAAAEGRTPDEVQRIQMTVGALVKQLLDAQREYYAAKTHETLAGMATDVEANTVVNDQVVVNLAFLLPRSRQAEFEHRVEVLDAEFGGELLFKVVGPLPPYSFSTVEIEKILPGDVTWASEQLGIGATASGEEIRAAYLRQARLHHPDHNPNDGEAANVFKDDNTAYQMLRYCHAMQHRALAPELPASEFCCDFGQVVAEGLLRVSISRSSDLATRN